MREKRRLHNRNVGRIEQIKQLKDFGRIVMLPCYVINLDRRPEKWEITRERLENAGFSPQRWSAVDGLKNPDVPFRKSPEWENMTPGAIGCALSHLAILQEMREKNLEHVVVFEDDAVPGQMFVEIAKGQGIKEDIDVVWMGSDVASVGTNSCFCTHAMIYSRSFVDKVFKYIDEHGLYSIDIIYKRMQMAGLIKFSIWKGEPTDDDMKNYKLYLARSHGAVFQDLTLSTDIWNAKVMKRFGYGDMMSKGSFFNFVNDPERCRTFVINLDRSQDRYKHFIFGAQDAGFHNIERFSAIDKLSPNFDRHNIPYKKDGRFNGRDPIAKPKWTNYEDMSDGQVACALSHLALMEQCIRDNKVYVVFEDDAKFVSEFAEVAEEYWRRTPPGTQLIIMGHNLEIPCGTQYVIRKQTWNMHAILYTPLFCKIFIDYINKVNGLFCIDINLIEFQASYPHYVAWLRQATPTEQASSHQNRCGGLVHQALEFGTLL